MINAWPMWWIASVLRDSILDVVGKIDIELELELKIRISSTVFVKLSLQCTQIGK